jgi:hypothetical protein
VRPALVEESARPIGRSCAPSACRVTAAAASSAARGLVIDLALSHEASVQQRLDGREVLALGLEAARLGEVQVDEQEGDEAGNARRGG